MAKKKKTSKKRAVAGTTGKIGAGIVGSAITKKRARKKKAAKRPEGTCFVMMPFREPFDLYYETIFIPAIRAANLEPKLASDLFRPSPIVADIWQMVQDATVLLAELTIKNANVFYELGLAHAIGKPVVLVSETMDDVPFDLQPLRVLTYDKDDPTWGPKLSRKITAALKETLSSPIEAVPGIFRKKVESKAPKQDATIARIEALEQHVRSLVGQGTTRADAAYMWKLDDSLRLAGRVGLRGAILGWLKSWKERGATVEELRACVNQASYLSDSQVALLRIGID